MDIFVTALPIPKAITLDTFTLPTLEKNLAYFGKEGLKYLREGYSGGVSEVRNTPAWLASVMEMKRVYKNATHDGIEEDYPAIREKFIEALMNNMDFTRTVLWKIKELGWNVGMATEVQLHLNPPPPTTGSVPNPTQEETVKGEDEAIRWFNTNFDTTDDESDGDKSVIFAWCAKLVDEAVLELSRVTDAYSKAYWQKIHDLACKLQPEYVPDPPPEPGDGEGGNGGGGDDFDIMAWIEEVQVVYYWNWWSCDCGLYHVEVSLKTVMDSDGR